MTGIRAELPMTNSVSFWKIVFSGLILALHCGVAKGGYIAVEFFFLVSGFLLAETYYRSEKKGSPLSYIKKRWHRLFPMYAASMLIYMLVFFWVTMPADVTGGCDIFYYLLRSIAGCWQQILMLHVWGTQVLIPVNPMCWYVAALFWTGILLYLLLRLIPADRLKWLLPLISIFILGCYFRRYGCLDFWELHRSVSVGGREIPVVGDSMMRAIAEMSLGISLYYLRKGVSGKLPERLKKVFLTVEPIGYVVIIAVVFRWGYTRWDFLLLAVLCVLVFISFLPHEQAWLNSKWVKRFSGWTYSVYLNQGVFIILLSHWLVPAGASEIGRWLILSGYIIVFSIIIQRLAEYLAGWHIVWGRRIFDERKK